MRNLTKLASKLYPRWWRERYGDEFAALLEDAKPGFRGALDVLKGALAMRLSTSSALKAIFVCVIAGVVGGIATTYFLTPQYSSLAVLSIRPPEGATERDIADVINTYSQSILTRNELTVLIRSFRLYPAERTSMTHEDVLELMRQNIRISPVPALVGGHAIPAFGIEFQYADRAAATNVVNALVTKYVDENLRARQANPQPTMEVLNPASTPENPVFPRRKSFAVAGLGTGLLLGSFAALILHLRRKRQAA